MTKHRSEATSLFEQACVLAARGTMPDAMRRIAQAIDRDPTFHPAQHALGVMNCQANWFAAGLKHLKLACQLDPRNATYRNDYGAMLVQDGNAIAAIPELVGSIALKPSADAALNLARAYRDIGQPDRATAQLQSLLSAQNPAHRIAAELEQARLFEVLGNMTAARQWYQKVLVQKPYEPRALMGLAMNGKATSADLIDLLQNALATNALPRRESAQLLRAKGKVLEDLERYDEAFMSYTAAHAAEASTFDIATYEKAVASVIAAFPREHFETAGTSAMQDETPVFVVGMPRSGTTLVQQIAAAHPEVCALDESNALDRALRSTLAAPWGAEQWITAVRGLRKAKLREIAGAYLAETRPIAVGKRRAINKTPHNFELIGLILRLFPNAKVIHCKRDAMDTCTSCYGQQFSQSHAYTNDLAVLGRYHRAYEKIMQHWHTVFPGRILELVYENLAQQPRPEIERLLRFMDLPWHESCLSPQRATNVVQTPSLWQVRNPINSNSIGRWRRFEKHLLPLTIALNANP